MTEENIKNLIIKSFEQYLRDVLNEYDALGLPDDDESYIAESVNERMNRKYKLLFKYLPDRFGFISSLEQMLLFGVRPFKNFKEKREFNMDGGDGFEIIMRQKQFQQYQTFLISDSDSDDFEDVNSDGLND